MWHDQNDILLLQKQKPLCQQVSEVKKLVVLSVTSLLVTKASMKNTLRPLKIVPCIYHQLYFQKNLRETRAFIDSNIEVNVITLVYIVKLSLKVRKTDIETMRIDDYTFSTFEIVLADFRMEDKLDRAPFFQKTFLIANTTLKIIFRMFFFTLSNIDI